MKKFCSLVVFSLTLVSFDARAAQFQTTGVRVGPLSEERVPESSEAPATKRDERKATPAETPVEKRAEPEKDSGAGKAAPRGERSGGKVETEKTQNPAALSTKTATAAAPAESGSAPVTSDAPPKSRADDPASAARTGTPGGGDGANAARRDPAPAKTSNEPALNTSAPKPPASSVSPTAIYRVGVGDVLDIRLLNHPEPRQSTLYTVLAGGVLEYPPLGAPMVVAGVTTDELADYLASELRHRRVLERPQVRVSVREYASHAVIVSGLVNDPGTKILRREAVPLYVIVAEAQPKPEAGRAVVMSHATGRTTSVDLADAAGLNVLVQQGDVVNLVPRPPEFFYIGGEINSPGQKDFHAGMTLTQAVLASGGVTRNAGGRVKVSRQGPDGRLVSTEYNLREIEDGVVPDPALQPGDRVEIARPRK